MKSILSIKDKRGVMGLDIAKKFVLGILSLALVGIISLVVMFSMLSASSGLPGTQSITSVINNATIGTTNFYGNVPLWFSLLGVVVIILIISVILVVVNRFGGQGEGGGL